MNKKQIKNIPNGDKIIVTWKGGNGPHEYFKNEFYGIPIAQVTNEPNDHYIVGFLFDDASEIKHIKSGEGH